MTRDGYQLLLPRAGVDAVVARLADGGDCAPCADTARRRVVGAVALAEVKVRRVKGTRAPTPAEWTAVLKGVEAAVVRTLVRAGKSLTNADFAGSDALPLGAGERIRITVEPTAAKPSYLPALITIVGPQRFEAEAARPHTAPQPLGV